MSPRTIRRKRRADRGAPGPRPLPDFTSGGRFTLTFNVEEARAARKRVREELTAPGVNPIAYEWALEGDKYCAAAGVALASAGNYDRFLFFALAILEGIEQGRCTVREAQEAALRQPVGGT